MGLPVPHLPAVVLMSLTGHMEAHDTGLKSMVWLGAECGGCWVPNNPPAGHVVPI